MSWYEEQEQQHLLQMQMEHEEYVRESARQHALATVEAEYMVQLESDLLEAVAKAYILIEDLEYLGRDISAKEEELLKFVTAYNFAGISNQITNECAELKERYSKYLQTRN